jgi:hypothetical protein
MKGLYMKSAQWHHKCGNYSELKGTSFGDDTQWDCFEESAERAW